MSYYQTGPTKSSILASETHVIDKVNKVTYFADKKFPQPFGIDGSVGSYSIAVINYEERKHTDNVRITINKI
jgi:hypothetical protein